MFNYKKKKMKNSSITVNKSGNIICDNSDKILRQSAREFPLAGEVSLFVLIRPSTDWVRPTHIMGFPGSSAGKNLPAMQETPVQFLGQEDPLEKG